MAEINGHQIRVPAQAFCFELKSFCLPVSYVCIYIRITQPYLLNNTTAYIATLAASERLASYSTKCTFTQALFRRHNSSPSACSCRVMR